MKDCDCRTHDGPHFLHMDAIWQEANRRILLQAIRYEEAALRVQTASPMSTRQSRSECQQWLVLRNNQLRCYLEAELRRLDEKKAAQRKRGIA